MYINKKHLFCRCLGIMIYYYQIMMVLLLTSSMSLLIPSSFSLISERGVLEVYKYEWQDCLFLPLVLLILFCVFFISHCDIIKYLVFVFSSWHSAHKTPGIYYLFCAYDMTHGKVLDSAESGLVPKKLTKSLEREEMETEFTHQWPMI